MSRTFIREQKHICGSSYETAQYMEVDVYPITQYQHTASRQRKRKDATSYAQQLYNDKRAKRYHVQLANTNFGKGDFSWTGTYDDEHLPAPEDRKQVDDDFGNYIKRIYRYCDRHGLKHPKWIAAAEYSTIQEDGKVLGRHHIHAIFEHVEGLTRDIMEELWRDRKGNRIGFTRCELLDVDHNSIEGLVKYISKNKKCARSWRQSRNLKKPITPQPNDSKWSKKKLHDASTLYIDDAAFWEKMYPGYTLNRVETEVSDSGQRHTLIIMRRLDAHHGKRRRC